MQYISSTCFFISYTVRTIVKSYGEYPGKLLAENRCMKILEEFLLEKVNRYINSVQRSRKNSRPWNILENCGLEYRDTIRCTKILRVQAWVRQIFHPFKGISFRARQSLIADIQAGSEEKCVAFCGHVWMTGASAAPGPV
jgi:hypothetical protein